MVFVFKENDCFLNVKTTVFGQDLRNNEQGFCEGLDTKFGFSLYIFAVLVKMDTAGNLKRTGSRNHAFIVVDVLYGS